VAGTPHPPQGLIELPLIKKGVGDRELVVPAVPGELGADPADTEYVTISRAAKRAAWVALRPLTGRTHQLRAHMKAIGHPILGDPKYSDEKAAELSAVGLKLQLHARRLTLPHPGGGMLIIEAPLSPEMKAGFAHFGFDEHEADPEPFDQLKRRSR
jgi:23S rRNA pseudouridine955/2504/2580 synthase